jgi:hypothetical protein
VSASFQQHGSGRAFSGNDAVWFGDRRRIVLTTPRQLAPVSAGLGERSFG